MAQQLGKKDVYWSYIGQSINYGVHIILTPIISVKLSSYELGLWYTFTSIFTLVNFFDTGFSPLIMRNAAYCMGGAKTLLREGILQETSKESPGANFGLLHTLYLTASRLYRSIAFVFLMLLLGAGIPYIRYITRTDFRPEYMVAWVIYTLGIAINVFMIFLPAFLKGMGSIAQVQRLYAIGRGTHLVFSIIGVLCGYGIVSLASGFLLGNLIICLGAYQHYFSKWSKLVRGATAQMSVREVLSVLWFNARKLGLVAIGRYLTTQGNILICSTFLTLEISASYGLTIQALQAMCSVSMIYLQAVVPSISAAKVTGQKEREQKHFATAMTIYWGFYICGSVALYFLANPLLKLIHANTTLLGGWLLVFAMVLFFLQYNQICFSLYIGMGNKVPYMKGEFFSGVAVVALAFVSAYFTPFGIVGILVVQFVAQACYNDWKWPLEACREIGMNPLQLAQLGLQQIAGLFRRKKVA